jgi:integrase
MATNRRGSGEGWPCQETRTRRLTSGDLVEYLLWVRAVEAERDPATGRGRRVRVTARTKAEAMRKMRLERDRIDTGQAPQDLSMTVERFLRWWTTDVLVHRVDTGTFVSYRGLINKHLIPGLGHLRLRDLRPEHVDRLLRAKADAGMARSSVGGLRSILTDALTHAERRQLVRRNVGRLSIMPAIPESEEQRALTAAERERFIATAIAFRPAKQDEDGRVPHRQAALMAVMFHVGLRPGEGTGLLWDDLDLAGRTLRVSGSCSMSRRGRLELG